MREALAKRVQAGSGLEPEHRAQDDLERQRLKARVEHDLAIAPGLDLGGRHLGHQAGQALHPLAVEGGQHQLSLRHVGVAVEEEHRVGADQREQDARADAGLQHVRRRGEDLLDLLGVGDDHERRGERELGREALAVDAAVALEPGDRAHPHAHALEQARGGGSGRELLAHQTDHPPTVKRRP